MEEMTLLVKFRNFKGAAMVKSPVLTAVMTFDDKSTEFNWLNLVNKPTLRENIEGTLLRLFPRRISVSIGVDTAKLRRILATPESPNPAPSHVTVTKVSLPVDNPHVQ